LKQQCGDWRLEREIGQGAYGVVYLAVGSDGVRAAVKVCRREAVGDERYERELRGAKLYRAIPPQEGLVRMRELVETEWGFYTVMDLADDEFGGPLEAASGYRPKTLARVIEGEKALPLKECVKLGIALAGGLATLQRHHLLHRDIKPGNVIYIGGKPVLSDPGLLVDESDAASLVGTPGYVPPENFTAAAGDIYSLGLTLKAASFGRKLEDLDKGPALEADTSAPLFPAWWRILNKATDPTPSRRYQSAKALIKDLVNLRRKIAVASVLGLRVAKVAIALFAIKYLRSRGYPVTNDLFAEKSFYFRNALVRANYENDRLGVERTQLPLEDFFKVLIYGDEIELRNRFLRIGQEYGTKTAEAVGGLHRQDVIVNDGANDGVNDGGKSVLNPTEEKAIKAILRNSRLKAAELAKTLGVKQRQAERVIAALKVKAGLKRRGADKNGEWYFE